MLSKRRKFNKEDDTNFEEKMNEEKEKEKEKREDEEKEKEEEGDDVYILEDIQNPNSTYVTIYDNTKHVCKLTYNMSKIYFMWVFIHYISVYLYTHYCVPFTLFGIIMSPLLITSHHCKALRWAINTGAGTLDVMWILIGTWICSKLSAN